MYQNCCKKCGSISLHTEERNNNVGLYCDDCGAWIKWLGKDELRAFNNSKNRESKPMQDTYLDMKGEFIRFIEHLENVIENEMSIMPLSPEDAIRKSSYCLALERDKNAIINILKGRKFDFIN